MAKEKILYDGIWDECGNFVTGWRITEGTKYITCAYLTNWQGARDKFYRIPKAEFSTPEQMIDDVLNWSIPCYKMGEIIQ